MAVSQPDGQVVAPLEFNLADLTEALRSKIDQRDGIAGGRIVVERRIHELGSRASWIGRAAQSRIAKQHGESDARCWALLVHAGSDDSSASDRSVT